MQLENHYYTIQYNHHVLCKMWYDGATVESGIIRPRK